MMECLNPGDIKAQISFVTFSNTTATTMLMIVFKYIRRVIYQILEEVLCSA